MQLKKLQVPVNIKKKRIKQPKLRKRIMVKPKIDQDVPDIKLPEISGIKGGLGGAAGGLGSGSGIGFSMPEIELFGIKSKGEKVCIILDSSPEMMYDEMGGIPAYSIIKEELVRILTGLPATTLFKVIVYDGDDAYMLFPNMVTANPANTAKVQEWLKPLNAVRPDMGSRDYGAKTLGKGGERNRDDFKAGKFQRQRDWYRAVMLAMKQQADSIFLLACQWGSHWHTLEGGDKDWYNTSAGRRWKEAYEESKRLLAEENRERAARGEPPRVIDNNARDMNGAYFPDIERPPTSTKYRYSSSEFIEAMLEIRSKYRPEEMQMKSGIQRNRSKGKIDFSFNVVHFRKVGESDKDNRFNELTNLCRGDYKMIPGLDAIKSYAGAK